ncbi:uncharacterized protein I303_107237 [Kwoniella dejecticola CBS 10117]|uniref:Uncharacterized protein n=1 Tax=Kwoniella dejecticola CBS 10117 TaxID=1296121 RepID=A0A1A5ZZ44_9TREE|nr:uncharacterized protein I303_06638 [Kwoniella dejecticola CBS 10117]OBR83079.1 hypothetical protein I303_06638 [Kwoniella dejecticola CBS 10117]
MDILLDDASPEITFFSSNNGWIDDHRKGSKYPDDYLSSYSQQTFHATYTDGDYMQYRFNGTGITIVGSRRKNHGVYGVKIDDENEVYHSGFSTNPMFQTDLYTRDNLTSDKEHTITVTNYPHRTDPQPSSTTDSWLDIDHLIITHNVSGDIYTTTIDDITPGISYDGTWTSDKTDATNYNETIHISYQKGMSMTLPFTGSSIQLFSGMNVDHLDYSVSLDGGPETSFNGTHFERLTEVPHFTASGLAEGQHTLKITNRGRGDTARPVMGFDFAIVNSTISPDGSGGGDTTSQQARPTFAPVSDSSGEDSQSKHIDAKAIAGGVAGGVVGLIAVAILAWHLLCRNPRKRNNSGSGRQASENRHKSYMDFATNNNIRSLGEVMETKSSSRSRMISNTSTTNSTKVNTMNSANKSSPSKFGSLGRMFSRRSTQEAEEEDGESARSTSPESSIAYLYTPHPGAGRTARSDSNSAGSGSGTGMSPGQVDSFDNQIYRNPPPSRPRQPIITESSPSNQRRNSITSRSSAYSQGGETDLTDRLDNINRTFPSGGGPTPLPSHPSRGSGEYEHMPLPPIPATTMSMPSNNIDHDTRLPLSRPHIDHSDTIVSSALLPSATIQQSLKSIPQLRPSTRTSSTNVSPSSTTTTTRSSGQTNTISPATPGDYKRGILGLVLDTAPLDIPGTEQNTSAATASAGASSTFRQVNLTPSVLDLEPPIVSPPPGYEHAMTAQQDERRPEP